MATVNIAKNYRNYSSDELKSLAYSGALECNGYCLSDFLEYIFQGMVSQDELDKEIEKAEEKSNELENVRESVREALAILEAIG